MEDAMVQDRINQFQKTCRKQGLRLTAQKQEIYRVVASSKNHPTAQEILEVVKERFPQISFATVYDNLRKFKDLGVVQELNCGGGACRYDANIHQHHHVIDRLTGRIMDVVLPIEKEIPVPDELKGKDISSIQITYII